MKTIYVLICMFTLRPVLLFSQTPDWSTGIASIIYEHCSHCHHEGAIAPFALMSYDDAALWAFSIQVQVNAKLMPPWPPDPNYNHLKDENVLSENELIAINSWVNNGMPMGNINLAPAPPVFNGGSLMLNPDETIELPLFTIPFLGDVYWRFANQSGYSEPKYLNSIEFVAGNPSIVHHIQFSQDSSGLSWQDDLTYPGPGYPREFGASPFVYPFMAQSEGRIVSLPENIGFEIPAGADYVTDIHYYTNTLGEIDSSKVNMKFCDTENVRSVITDKALYGKWPSLIDGPLEIPANTVKTFHLRSSFFSEDQSLLGLGPHAHLICKSWKVYMVIPSGDTIPLISIPNWDFDWQGAYLLTKVIKIPQGSQLFATVEYDNTINNLNNPSNPPQDVEGGDSRFDEMAQVRFWLMDYQPGDEDIILDSSFYFSTNSFTIESENSFNVFPNPASQSISVEYSVNNSNEAHFTIFNQLGELLLANTKKTSGNKGSVQIDCSTIPSGMYLLMVQSGSEAGSKKFIIEK